MQQISRKVGWNQKSPKSLTLIILFVIDQLLPPTRKKSHFSLKKISRVKLNEIIQNKLIKIKQVSFDKLDIDTLFKEVYFLKI